MICSSQLVIEFLTLLGRANGLCFVSYSRWDKGIIQPVNILFTHGSKMYIWLEKRIVMVDLISNFTYLFCKKRKGNYISVNEMHPTLFVFGANQNLYSGMEKVIYFARKLWSWRLMDFLDNSSCQTSIIFQWQKYSLLMSSWIVENEFKRW